MTNWIGVTVMVELTPGSVIARLAEIGRRIDEVTSELPDLELAEMYARNAYKKAYAKAFLSAPAESEGQRVTEAARKAMAELATYDELLTAELALIALKTKRDELKSLQLRLDIGRSLSAVMRMEWSQS